MRLILKRYYTDVQSMYFCKININVMFVFDCDYNYYAKIYSKLISV